MVRSECREGVGDPAFPRRSEDELVDPTCSELWCPLVQSGAQSGVLARLSVLYTPLGLASPDQNLRTCFVLLSLPRTFSSSNRCHGFVHRRNGGSQGSWQAAKDGRWGSGALLGLLCDLGHMVYLWESLM